MQIFFIADTFKLGLGVVRTVCASLQKLICYCLIYLPLMRAPYDFQFTGVVYHKDTLLAPSIIGQ